MDITNKILKHKKLFYFLVVLLFLIYWTPWAFIKPSKTLKVKQDFSEIKIQDLQPSAMSQLKKQKKYPLKIIDYTKNTANKEKGLFGFKETKSNRLKAFSKWNKTIIRHKKDLKNEYYDEPGLILRKNTLISKSRNFKIKCGNKKRIKCAKEEWLYLLKALKKSSWHEKLNKVNYHMNNSIYITDINNWGVNDYWATLKQFFRRNGDCEDYAIAKYFSLKKIGFKADNMRIAVVQDMNLNVAHAILIVYINDKTFILDNQIATVVKASAILHYKPLYSINENAWWMHHS